MQFFHYLLVFVGSLLVDIIPFVGPPAWIVMVFFQVRFSLNIWYVLIAGVLGSAIGRFLYSIYVSYFADHFIKPEKNEDLKFIGKKLSGGGWRIYGFVFLYTLMPLPSTPLFTAAGIARIKTGYLIPPFLAGKFISDAIMVFAGNYVAYDMEHITQGFLTWQNIVGVLAGSLVISLFLFIDWRKLIEEKKFRIQFKIWN